ncbi:MAG: CDP-alcohol phosphatidyltransferase family protein [Pseudomonadota bacterium]
MFGVSRNALWAFGVHILTASGAFLAFLSIVAAANYDFPQSFFWLGMALVVDGIDGPLARKLEVKTWWPHWSGDTLDNVIDYTTFVMIPAFILYQSGLLDHTNALGQKEELISKVTSFTAAAVIVITSAIYYADTRMKTEDYGFKGFPVCWNMVVFALFVVSPSPTFSLVFIIFTAIMTFVPVIFIHPGRVKILRPLNLVAFVAWGVSGLIAVYFNLDNPIFLDAIFIACSLYLFCIGFILQLMGKLK